MSSYRIPNTYQTPIASALGNLFTAFSSIPTAEDVALKQAKYDDLTSSAALNRSRVEESQRKAATGGNLAGVFREVLRPTEQDRTGDVPVGPMPAVPVDEKLRAALPSLVGSLPPEQIGDLGGLVLALGANAGASPQTVTNAGLGAKVPYNSTQLGAEAERDRKIQLEDRKDQRAQQSARYAADRSATTQDRIDARQGRKIVGDDGNAYWFAPGMPYHGMRAEFSQQSGPLVTDAVKARGQLSSLDRFRQKGQDLLGLARADSSALGAAGSLRTMVAGAAEQAKALGQSFGMENAPALVGQAQEFLRQNGITVADPTVASKLAVYLETLPFDAAEALAGQTGRSVTNEDVKRFQRVVGSTPITNLADLEARWEILSKMIDEEVARIQPRLNTRPPQPGSLAQPGLGANVQQAFPSAAPAQATAPGATPKVQRWGRDASGKPVPLGP